MSANVTPVWTALLEAAHRDWGPETSRQHALPDGRLVLHRSGRWEADFDPGEDQHTLLDSLTPLASASRFTLAQLGQSLDGRIATASGHSHYINGPVALTHLHRLRALVDAVVVGAGTASADRPQLTVRRVAGPSPVRVVIDPNGRVPSVGPLFEAQDNAPPVLHLVGPDARPDAAPAHVERLRLEPSGDGFAPSDILHALDERGLSRVLVEGGADTISRFLQADTLDRLHLLIAPLIIGSGRSGLELPPIERLEEARRPPIHGYALGDELLVDVDLRRDPA